MGTYAPGDLNDLKEPLIEAVIDAYMAQAATSTGLEFDHGSCGDGEFRFRVEGKLLDRDTRVYCSYPGGQWREDEFWSPDSDKDVGDSPAFGATLFDAKAKFEEIRQWVDDWVDPWTVCPDPSDIAVNLHTIVTVSKELYVQDEVRLNGEMPTAKKSKVNKEGGVPNTDILSCITDIGTFLQPLVGEAIDALKVSYVNDVGLTLSGQRALATTLVIAVAGEAEAWHRTYKTLTKFITASTSDFAAYARSRAASGSDTRAALGAVSGVATIASAGTAAFPPIAATLAGIAGLSAVGAAYWPLEEGLDRDEALVLDGDFDSMWTGFETAIWKIWEDLTQAEFGMGQMCLSALADLAMHPEAFSIGSWRGHDTNQDNDNLHRFINVDPNSPSRELNYDTDIRIVQTKLRKTSGRIEHIADHQRHLANSLDGPGAPIKASAWSPRGVLHGRTIGWTSDGHLTQAQVLLDQLITLLVQESRTAHRVAEQCLEIGREFKLTDEQIESRLNRREERLAQ